MQDAKYKGAPRFSPIREGMAFYWRDNKERINFDRSKYIPGNGVSHRLGRGGR